MHYYMQQHNYDEDIKDLIIKVIFALDKTFLDYQEEKIKKESEKKPLKS